MFILYLEAKGQDGLTIKNGCEKGNVWIERDDGEGGDFNKAKLLEVLNKFYKDNF